MKALVVTGSREWTGFEVMSEKIATVAPDLVIQGGARGADAMAAMIAVDKHLGSATFPANWGVYHRAAGPIRNQKMVEFADALRGAGWEVLCCAFHPDLNASKGTADMVWRLRKAGFEVDVIANGVL